MKKEKEYWENLRKQIEDAKKQVQLAESQMDASKKNWFDSKAEDSAFKLWSMYQEDQKSYIYIKNLLTCLEVENHEKLFATEYVGSDRYAWEVLERKSPSRFIIRRLKAKNNGQVGEQDWTFETDPNGQTIEIRRKKNKLGWCNGSRLFLLGTEPYAYYDWSF